MMYGRMREGATPVLNAVSLFLMIASALLALTLMRRGDRRQPVATPPACAPAAAARDRMPTTGWKRGAPMVRRIVGVLVVALIVLIGGAYMLPQASTSSARPSSSGRRQRVPVHQLAAQASTSGRRGPTTTRT